MKAAEILQQYQNGQRNFQGLNLRGLNFAQKDLSGADFSHCQIQGTNFKEANLTGANFTGAKAGLQKRWFIGLLLVVLVLIVISSPLLGIIAFPIVESFYSFDLQAIVAVSTILIALIVFNVVIYDQGLGVGSGAFIFTGFVVVSIALTVSIAFPKQISTGNSTVTLAAEASAFGIFGFGVILTIIITLIFASAMVGVLALISADIFAFTLALTGMIVGVVIIIKMSGTATFVHVILSLTIGILLILFACFIGYRTLKDDTRDVWLRNIVIAFAGIVGTSFSNATLTDANFTAGV